MEDKLERMRVLKKYIDDGALESGIPVREQLPEMEKTANFKKLRDETLKRAKKVISEQEDGSSFEKEFNDKERYKDISESGMSMEDKEEAAAKSLYEKRKSRGLEQ